MKFNFKMIIFLLLLLAAFGGAAFGQAEYVPHCIVYEVTAQTETSGFFGGKAEIYESPVYKTAPDVFASSLRQSGNIKIMSSNDCAWDNGQAITLVGGDGKSYSDERVFVGNKLTTTVTAGELTFSVKYDYTFLFADNEAVLLSAPVDISKEPLSLNTRKVSGTTDLEPNMVRVLCGFGVGERTKRYLAAWIETTVGER